MHQARPAERAPRAVRTAAIDRGFVAIEHRVFATRSLTDPGGADLAQTVAAILAGEIGRLLESNVRRIRVIPNRKVAEWLDENSDWSDYTEIGKALDADKVVAVDLQSFTIYEGQTLYQGKANVGLRVYDCRGDGKLVFEKELPQSVYPPNAVVETSKKAEREFRREYVAVLADQIGRHFYPHDAHADYVLDTVTLD